jgi:uncharacterized protein (DUF2336 family)
MHPRVLAERNAKVQIRLQEAVEKLAKRFGLSPDLVASLTVFARDPEVRVLMEREAMADVLEGVLKAAWKKPKGKSKKEPDAPEAEKAPDKIGEESVVGTPVEDLKLADPANLPAITGKVEQPKE